MHPGKDPTFILPGPGKRNRFIECVVGQLSRLLDEQQFGLTLDHSQARDKFRSIGQRTE